MKDVLAFGTALHALQGVRSAVRQQPLDHAGGKREMTAVRSQVWNVTKECRCPIHQTNQRLLFRMLRQARRLSECDLRPTRFHGVPDIVLVAIAQELRTAAKSSKRLTRQFQP